MEIVAIADARQLETIQHQRRSVDATNRDDVRQPPLPLFADGDSVVMMRLVAKS